MNTQFSKYPKLQNLKTEFIPISEISQSLEFEKRKQNEIKLKKQEKFKGKWDRDVNPPVWSFVRNILKDCFKKKVEVVEHFNGMIEDDKDRFLNGCVNLFGKYGRLKRRNEKLRERLRENIIKEYEPLSEDDYSLESMWKIHSTHQGEIKNYKDEINLLKHRLKGKNDKIKSLKSGVDIHYQNRLRNIQEINNNLKKGYDGLIQRNMELQNRIFYEERVNRILKGRIKNLMKTKVVVVN